MITLMFLCYAAACIVAFRILRLKANTWTISTAVLGGLFGVGGVVVVLNYNQPFTPDARLLFYTTPMFSTVTGRVVDVPAQPNTPVRKGDVLFRLDPAPFQDALDQKKAELADAQQKVRQLAANLEAATADVTALSVQAEFSRKRLNEVQTLARTDAATRFRLEDEQKATDALDAQLSAARARETVARLAATSEIQGVNTDVARLRAEVARAEFELQQATVRAPTDGYVVQLFLRPGMAVMPMPIRPVMVFVHTDESIFAASFSQNVVQRIRSGSEAEAAFDAIPGRVFSGRVERVVDAVTQGQLQPSGDLVLPEQRAQSPGKVLVIINLTDNLSGYQLPAGSSAQVAVYSDHMAHVAIIRRILLRMKSWLNYLAV